MVDLVVLYGSEARILRTFLPSKNRFFIKIYNKNKPKAQKNSASVNSFETFKLVFEDVFKKSKPARIIFIGAAFLANKKLFASENDEDLEVMMQTNITNYLQYTKFLIPYMIKIKAGNFIFLSSFSSVVTTKGTSFYSASKSFCEKFFEVIGKEYGKLGIYSCVIRLGCFDGKMFDSLESNVQESYLKSIGNGELGSPDDVAKAIDFILECNYTSGGVIDLLGGINHNS